MQDRKNRPVIVKELRILTYLLILLSPFIIPGLLTAQVTDIELTEEEIQNHRDRLIQEGILQEVSEQLPFQATSTPLLRYASYSNKRFDLPITSSRGTHFRSDGTRMYILSRVNRNIAEYHLSQPWDISTASYERELDISTEADMDPEDLENLAPHGIYIREDGERMWMFNRREMWEYTLSTAWNIESASQTGYINLSDYVLRGHDIDFKPDGTVLYVDDRGSGLVFQFDLSSPWDIESTVTSTGTLDLSGISNQEIRGIEFSPDGGRLFVNNTGSREIFEYALDTPYDVSTASSLETFDISSQAGDPRQITFGYDFSRFYVTDTDNDRVYQYQIVGTEESELLASATEVQANGQDSSEITVILRDRNGQPIEDFQIELEAVSGSLQVSPTSANTDSDGEVRFEVTNTTVEEVEYRAVAGGIRLQEQVAVHFIPPAPVALSASDVEARQFTANWEMINGVTSYRLDVSTDSTFTTYLSGFEDTDVGNVTSYSIEELAPGTDYVYRVRAITEEYTSADSEVIQTTTFPETPVAVEASGVNAVRFIANWQQTEGARNYLLDVAEDTDFEQFVEGYENLSVGDSLSHTVSGLEHGSLYFYRVRAEAGPRVSGNSNRMEAVTLTISEENSDIVAEQLRVLANGEQSNEVDIVVRSDEGVLLAELNVELRPDENSSKNEVIRGTTDEEGAVQFGLTNTVAETVTYSVYAESIFIGDLSVEFLPDEGVLALGENYPNPFRAETTIPLTVPRPMPVNLSIYDVLGKHIQTLIDGNVETGYHEVPFQSTGLASGVYFYRLIADGEAKTRKMVFVW